MADNYFLQKLSLINGDQEEDIDLAFLLSVTYVEAIDLSAPKLIIKFNDREGFLREDIELSEGSILKAVLADPHYGDRLTLEERFEVLTMPVDAEDIVTINAIAEVVGKLKKAAVKARFFVGVSAAEILRELVPGVKVLASNQPIVEPYHLLPGMRPSRLIRQMAKEQGCVVFYRRGELVYKPLKELLSMDSEFVYHYDDNREKYQLLSYKQISARPMIADRALRNYSGWHITKGSLESLGRDDCPIESTGLTSPLTLNNMSVVPVTVLDVSMAANAGLKSGATVGFVWNRGNIESPMLETLPEKVVIGTIAIQYAAQRFYSRVKGVLL